MNVIIVIVSMVIFTFLLFKVKTSYSKNLHRRKAENNLEVFEHYTKITTLFSDFIKLDNIQRCSIVSVIDNKREKEFEKTIIFKILFTLGIGVDHLREIGTFPIVDKYYPIFLNDLKTKDFCKIITSELPECELKSLCEDADVKAFYAFKLIEAKNKFIYCTVSLNKIDNFLCIFPQVKILKNKLFLLVKDIFN